MRITTIFTTFLLPAFSSARLTGNRNLVSDGADDYWRRAGLEPTVQACGTFRPPNQDIKEGYEIKITVNQLCDYNGVLLEPSTEGGMNVGWLHRSNSVTFDVALPTAGLYEMEVRVSSPTGDGAFTLSNRKTSEIYKVFTEVPETGSWQEWETLTAGELALPSGSSTLQVKSLQGGWNLLWVKLTMLSVIEDQIRISAGEMTTPTDVELDQSSEGGENLAYIFTGDTLDFKVNLPYSGKYRLQARVSNARLQGAFMVTHSKTGEVLGKIDFLPPTKDWYTWATVRIADVFLGAGEHELEIFVMEGGFNLGWFGLDLVEIDDSSAVAEETTTSFVIPARNYVDAGGVLVDGRNNNVGGIDAFGDFLKYKVNIPTAGSYTLKFSVASPSGKGSLVVVNGETQAIIGIVDEMPTTGGWHNWADAVVTGVELPQGLVPLEVRVTAGGWNLMVIAFELEEA